MMIIENKTINILTTATDILCEVFMNTNKLKAKTISGFTGAPSSSFRWTAYNYNYFHYYYYVKHKSLKILCSITLFITWLDRSFLISSSLFSANIASFLAIISSLPLSSFHQKHLIKQSAIQQESNFNIRYRIFSLITRVLYRFLAYLFANA